MRDILPVVVDGLWRQGAKNLAVRLVSADGQPLPAWTPGAHIDLHLPCGLIRQYSLTGSPAGRDHYLLCVAREAQSRGGSRYIHDTLRPGQPLLISAPRNHFPLRGGGHVVLLAAGIGITPLLAMAHARAASGASFTLHYYVSRAQEAARHRDRQPAHRRNLPDPLLCRRRVRACGWRRIWGAPDADTRVYFCGPAGFMNGARHRAGGRLGGGATAQRSVPAARHDGGLGGGRNLHHHPRLHRGALAGTGEQNHRPGAAGAWRRCAALLRNGDLRRLPDAGAGGNGRPPGYRAVGGGKTGSGAAYCAVLLPQPVGQFSYRSRGISDRSPAVRRGRPVSPARR